MYGRLKARGYALDFLFLPRCSSFLALMQEKKQKKIKASTEAGGSWPGIGQTWLASLTPTEAVEVSRVSVKLGRRP